MATSSILLTTLTIGLLLFTGVNAVPVTTSTYLKQVCKNQRSGLFAYIYNCNQFVQCSNGIPYLSNCAGLPWVTLYFNTATQTCDWPSALSAAQIAACSQSEQLQTNAAQTSSVTTAAKISTVRPTTAAKVSTTASKTSIVTTAAKASTAAAKTSTVTTAAKTSVVTTVVTTTAPSQSVEQFCTDKYDGWYVYIYDCSQYIECTNHQASLRSCPRLSTTFVFYFNDQYRACDYPNNLSPDQLAACSQQEKFPVESSSTLAEPLPTDSEISPSPAEPLPTPAEPLPTPAEPLPTDSEISPSPAEPLPTRQEPSPTPAEPSPTPAEPLPTDSEISPTPAEP